MKKSHDDGLTTFLLLEDIVDYENKMVNVSVTKNRKPLIIPLNDDIISILQEYSNLYSNPLEPETPQIVPNGMSIVKEAVA